MTDTRLRTPASWRGMPVPWVVRWSSETADPALRLGWRNGRLSYRRELSIDRRFGALWYRNRTGTAGEPEFAELHTARQLACMTRHLCQVCGARAVDADGRISWLLPGEEWRLLSDPANPQLVMTPPTCRECWPLATRHCPHLRATGAVPAAVAATVPVAAYGDLYHPLRAMPYAVNEMVALADRTALRFILAKQLVVELRNIQIERR